MTIHNLSKFESNYARAAFSFIVTCAKKPDNAEHRAAHEFLTGIYAGIAANPEAFGFKPLPDVWFDAWEQQKERQNDVKAIREPISKIEVLISGLFDMVVSGNAEEDTLVFNDKCGKPAKSLLKALSAVGLTADNGRITFPAGCLTGLKELAGISQKHIIHITDSPKPDKAYLYFSRCVFEPESNWLAEVFDRALDANGRVIHLCAELEERGYTRIDCKDGKRISLDYVKQYGKKEEPVKMSWADKTHYGIELTFEDLRLEPYFLWLRMPAFKSVLERCGDFPDDISKFIADSTKTCNGCRYCVQTDKTGTRPLAAVTVNGKKKCPYYPSFSMNWRSLSPQLAESIISVLDAVYDSKN